MALTLGTTALNKLYLGSMAINKAYLGANVLIAASSSLVVSRVVFSSGATVPETTHDNSAFWGADAGEEDNLYNFALDLSGAVVGDLLLVAAGGRRAIAGLALDGTAMTQEIYSNNGVYRAAGLWSHVVTSGDISGTTPLVLTGTEQERGITALLVKGGVLQQVAKDDGNNVGFTLSVTATDARNEVVGIAFGEGNAFSSTGYAMGNLTLVETLGWEDHDSALGNIGVAYGTTSNISVGSFSSTFTPVTGRDSAGLLILLEPSA